MKKIVMIFIVCFLCITYVTPCIGAEFENPPVTDLAGYLNETQLTALSQQLEEIRRRYNFDVAIVTEEEMSGTSAMTTADDIYDYSGYGGGENDDGILLYICSAQRKYHLTTHGDGLRVFNENGIKYLQKKIQPELEGDNWFKAMEIYADLAEELLKMASEGEPFNKKQHDTKYYIIVWSCILLLPLLIAFLCMKSKLAKMKTAVGNDYAASYIKPGSKRLDVSRDIFLYSHISKVEKPKNNSGVHKSSSGRTHGGGGGSF